MIALQTVTVRAQPVGTCKWGTARAYIDANQVRAGLFNTGSLFWNGYQNPYRYNVPKSTNSQAHFIQSLWIGGLVDGKLRMSGSDYGAWELWPGPIDDEGNPPIDCSQYDRLYSVKRIDIERYDRDGTLTDDLRDWPVQLGAPVEDGDGDPDNYNLRGGDRPAIKGDQTVWWVMNDLGNEHSWSLTAPLQIEVRVTAYAFTRPERLSFTTFYEYEIVNRNPTPIEEMYFGIWASPDLGYGGDDYIGSDTTLGLGFLYNGDDFDETDEGYGDRPPALGYRFVNGPQIPPDGTDNDRDGEVDEPGERLPMTTFVYNQSSATEQGNPLNAREAYWFLQGRWRDGIPVTVGGSGRGFSDIPIRFVYPGEPGEFWSEENIDGSGVRNTPSSRRMIIATGPFAIESGRSQRITYAIIFSQGADRLDSVRELKKDATYVQAAFDVGFRRGSPPDPPTVTATELDGSLILKWDNEPTSNNYLDSYDVADPFISKLDVDDKTYTLEGYEVFRFRSASDSVGEIIATFDKTNNIGRVVDIVAVDDQTATNIVDQVAWGTDSGVRHAMRIDSLTNYRSYHFGVRAYAYSENSDPHVIKSAFARVAAQPSNPIARQGGTVFSDTTYGQVLTLNNGGVTKVGLGSGDVTATVVDPIAVTGHTYRVEFDESEYANPAGERLRATYTIVDEETGLVRLDGGLAESILGKPTTQAEEVVQIDGLSISITGPTPGPLDIDDDETWAFVQVQGGDGLVDACDAGAASRFGCAETGGNWIYGSFNGAADWVMYHSGGAGPEETIGAFVPNDFEIRATQAGSYGYFNFSSGNVIRVPFEAWDIGPTGIFGVNDPSDDVELIPGLFSDGGGECAFGFGEGDDPFGLGWQITDRIYAFYPVAGQTYADWEASVKPLVEAHPEGCPTSPETDNPAKLINKDARPLQRLIFMMDSSSPYYRDEFLPIGNVIRFYTTKPNLPGDTFWIHTAGFEPQTNDLQTAKAVLERIGVVPNPYKGVSDYELTTIHDAVRFTNLPDVATIRIYNLAGVLMTQLEKTPATTGLEWDLTNGDGNHISSGMYLVHVDVPGVGERTIKFGLVKKRR